MRRDEGGRSIFPLRSSDIVNWQTDNNLSDFDTSELDLRLEGALRAIYTDDLLAKRLIWKGGTAINKLYLANLGIFRLSVDLDFNSFGPKEEVVGGDGRRFLRDRLRERIQELDKDSEVRIQQPTWSKDELRWFYRPLSNQDVQSHIKIEISTIERFSILGLQNVPFQCAYPKEQIPLEALSIEELLATKLRACFCRRKGRDVYDLYRIFEIYQPQHSRLRKMVLYYFYRSGLVFHPKTFFNNLDAKFADFHYATDLQPYLRTDESFDWPTACQQIRQHLSFLEDLDERDMEFLLLARHLLKDGDMPTEWFVPEDAEKPLLWLFNDIEISETARNITLNDIVVYKQKK
jgi:predicted nucleotidyltransferase component of viral defense system